MLQLPTASATTTTPPTPSTVETPTPTASVTPRTSIVAASGPVEPFIEVELAKPTRGHPLPHDANTARMELENIPGWILDRLKVEFRRRKEMEGEVIRLENVLQLEKEGFQEWKEKSVSLFRQQLNQKDQVNLLPFFVLDCFMG
jgi:hypothetical protein